MKKLWIRAAALALGAALLAAPLAACNKEPEGPSELSPYTLQFVEAGGGYAVQIGRGDALWSNAATGVFGVQVSYDRINGVGDVAYAYYDSYEAVEGGWLAKAGFTAEDGSTFAAEDTYRVSEKGVEVVRTFRVLSEGSAEGFMTYYPVRDAAAGDVMSREWFAPGAYYGNDEYNFWGTGIKIGYTADAVANVDNLSAPVVANYAGGTAFSITDRTEGYRETVIEDTNVSQNSILVSDAFNIPGIGLRDVGEGEGAHVEMYHCYPAFTHNYINIYPFTYNYRMLPVEEGLERETAFEIRIGAYENFDAAVETLWRDVYAEYSVVERRYAARDAYEALTGWLYRSYGVLNSVPQYMTNSDHPYSESGFLYRNADLAYLMIAAGYRLGKPEYIEQADALIDYHIARDLIVDNIVNEFERAEAEGVMAVLNAYKTHLAHGVDKSDWLAYVLRKAREKKEEPDPMAIPLFLAVAEYTKDDSYVEVSASLLEDLDAQHKEYYYTGAIVNNSGDAIPNRESGMIYLDIYLDMYELTGDAAYLEHAKRCEVYLESQMIVQNIALVAEGTTGYETLSDGRFREIGTLGNEQVKPYGLSWVSGQTASADNASAYSVPDVLRLYEITGEEKYRGFADYLMTNSLLYINMGDKSWLMDDIRHSSGTGFQNEYFGIAASTDVVSAGRGTMHMSNLGWNMFVVLNSLEYWAQYDEGFLKDTVDPYDTSVLKYTDATSALSTVYRPYNAVDKDAATLWRPAADDAEKALTVDLGEYVSVTSVRMAAQGVASAKLSASVDGVNFTELEGNFTGEAEVGGVYRYVRIALTDCGQDAGIADIDVLGNPVAAQDYARGAEVTVTGVAVPQMTDGDYTTRWASGGRQDTILVDLGTIRGVTEVSMLFNINVYFNGQDYISRTDPVQYSYRIEYSPTGDDGDWHVYADRRSEPRMLAVYDEQLYVRARYFRITAEADRGVLSMTELKIFGV